MPPNLKVIVHCVGDMTITQQHLHCILSYISKKCQAMLHFRYFSLDSYFSSLDKFRREENSLAVFISIRKNKLTSLKSYRNEKRSQEKSPSYISLQIYVSHTFWYQRKGPSKVKCRQFKVVASQVAPKFYKCNLNAVALQENLISLLLRVVMMASWGVAPSIELWLLTTRAGVRISSVLTNAMHKFVELYALNQITLGVWYSPSQPPGAQGAGGMAGYRNK